MTLRGSVALAIGALLARLNILRLGQLADLGRALP